VNTAETLTPATLFRFPLQRLQSLMQQGTQLQLHLLVKAAHALRAAQRQIIVLGRHDSYSRIAGFLLDLGQHVAFHDNAPTNLRLPMSRVDIADYLGISSETVTRALSKLEHDGMITRVSPRSLRIDDLVELTNLAHGRHPR
jgi:CRP/FNR family transcriptional regulator